MNPFFDALAKLFPERQCAKCARPLESAADAGPVWLCPTCVEATGLKLHLAQTFRGPFEVFACFRWNRRIKRLWYGVKFYRRYGIVRVLRLALQQAVTPLASETFSGGRVLVVHPPFRPGRPNLFAPLLTPLCRVLGWHYLPRALAWGECVTVQPQKQKGRRARYANIHTRFTPTPQLQKMLVKNWPDRIILFDDLLTSGATLQATHHAVQRAVTDALATPQLDATLKPPALFGLVLLETPLASASPNDNNKETVTP